MNLAEIKENKQTNKISRRKMLSILCISGLSAGAFVSCAPNATSLKNDTQRGSVAGTPRQFTPSNGPDAQPFVNDIQKYPKCPYCGMNRKQWNHSRHLVHYSDDLVDPTCSLHCVAISLSLNLDRGPKAIYAADFGSDSQIKPLVNVDEATYLVGSDLPGTMTKQSKMAFSSPEGAKTAGKNHGGELVEFDEALTRAYLSMAKDTTMIRKKRAAKRKKMKQ